MASYTLSIYKRTEKSFDITIPNFTPSTSSSGATFESDSTMVVDHVHLNTKSTGTFASHSDMIVSTPTLVTVPTVVTYNAMAGYDGWGIPSPVSVNGTYTLTSNYLVLGNTSPGNTLGKAKSYVSFPVTLAMGLQITYATLILEASSLQNKQTTKVKIFGDKSGESSYPGYWLEIDSKVLTTSYYSSTGVPTWADKTLHYFDVTDIVQEILNLSDWISGHPMGFIFSDFGSTSLANRQVTTTTGETADATRSAAHLKIVYGGSDYVFDGTTTTAGIDWSTAALGRTSTGTFTSWTARIELTRPVKLSSVLWDIGRASTYNLKIQNDASTTLYDLGNNVVTGRTADVAWTIATPIVLPTGIYRFLMTPTAGVALDFKALTPLADYGFFNYLTTYFNATSFNYTLPLKLVGYVHS